MVYAVFRFEAVYAFNDLQSMKTVVADAAFATSANPEFAQVTIKHVEVQIARTDPVNAVGDQNHILDEAAAKLFGADAKQTLSDAAAAIDLMSPDARAWTQNTMRSLDGNTPPRGSHSA